MRKLHKYWTVLKTKEPTSKEARRQVRCLGFESYYPMFRARPKAGVRKVLPLFPYYLLVRINTRSEGWKDLSSARGVSYVFMSGQLPSVVANVDVERFRELENEMGYVVLPEHDAPRFESQSPVQVQGGWLTGCAGIYQGLAGTSYERVNILFSILGKPKMLEMSAFDLAAG